MFTGANTDDVHLRGVDVERDIDVGRWADLREAAAGQACPQCGQPLQVQKSIEVGHIFKLGYKYSQALGATVLDAGGERVPLIMGSYGIGVERAMAAIVECHHDAQGIVWPLAVAPFHVAVVVAQSNKPDVVSVGERIYERLRAAGIEVIIDDRPERVGVKFRDAELVGIPLRVTVGARGLTDGLVELTERASAQTRMVPHDEITDEVRKLVTAMS